MRQKTIAITVTAIVMAIIFQPGHVYSQVTKGQSEFSAGIGIQSDYELVTRFTAGDNDNYPHAPAYTVSYRYHFTHCLSLGLTFNYQHINDYNHDGLEYGRNKHTTSSFYFVAPEITLCYLSKAIGVRKNELRLYGLFAPGIALYKGNNQDIHDGNLLPAFQLTPIGVRFGKDLAAYLEAGFGNKGLINAGISYRPRQKANAQNK